MSFVRFSITLDEALKNLFYLLLSNFYSMEEMKEDHE